MNKYDKAIVKYAEWVIKWRWIVIALTIFAVFASGYGVKNLGFATNYRVFFSKENPQLNAFEELRRVYSKTDNLLYILKPKNGDVFTPDTLKAVQKITEEGWKIPFANRVDSITNFQYTYAEGDNLTVLDLVEDDPDSLSAEELAEKREIALKEPLLIERIISPEAKTTGVNVTLQIPQKDPTEVTEATIAARKLLQAVQNEHPNIDIRLSGVVMMNNAFSETSIKDMETLIPLMYVIIVVVMALMLRSVFGTIATVLVIAFSAITGMGMAGWYAVELTPPSSTAPTIILTLAIADSIHILSTIFKEMQHGMTKREAIIESIRVNMQPVFLTSLTTVIGFLSLNFSDAPPFWHLGNITAVGITAAFFYSVLFLPAIMYVFPCGFFNKRKVEKERRHMMDDLGDFVARHSRKLFLSVALVIVLLATAIPRIELNDEFVKYFDYSIPFRGDTEFMMENLTGIYQIEYSLGAGADNAINEPSYLQNVENYANWLNLKEEVQHVYSITDIYKRLNKNMHGDDESWYRLPDSRELAAQYLLLYEMSLPYGLDLNDRINVNKSASRLTVTLGGELSTKEIRDFKERSEGWLKSNTPEYMHAEASSPVVMFAYISERNINSMLTGNLVAILLISLSIGIALRSAKIGLVSLIPNLVPIVIGLGIWGIFMVQIDMAVAIVSAASLGIIVDDTVHFLSKYFRAIREKNLGAHDAIRYTFSVVGNALFITTVILVTGFSILIGSGFKMNDTLGMLTAIVIFAALVADFFLLPHILIMLDKKGNKI